MEVHLGHNYFASSFSSPKLNRRKDSYGGSLANRARVAMDSLRAVRESVGDRIAVTAKMNMDDGVAGGFWIDEAVQLAQWLESEGLVDALQLTVGSSLLNSMYLFRGEPPVREMAELMPPIRRLGLTVAGKHFLHHCPYEPLFMLEQARQIRAAVKMPLILLGGVTDRDGMDTAMANGFEFVAMARALLREPDLVHKLRRDQDARAVCIHATSACPRTSSTLDACCVPTVRRRLPEPTPESLETLRTADWTKTQDLTTEFPGKLAELQRLSELEAAGNQVLRDDNRMQPMREGAPDQATACPSPPTTRTTTGFTAASIRFDSRSAPRNRPRRRGGGRGAG